MPPCSRAVTLPCVVSTCLHAAVLSNGEVVRETGSLSMEIRSSLSMAMDPVLRVACRLLCLTGPVTSIAFGPEACFLCTTIMLPLNLLFVVVGILGCRRRCRRLRGQTRGRKYGGLWDSCVLSQPFCPRANWIQNRVHDTRARRRHARDRQTHFSSLSTFHNLTFSLLGLSSSLPSSLPVSA